jgi:archaellum component FlaF (FlaF/FlaG flagellin family)
MGNASRSGGGSAGTILGAVVLSIVIIGGITYFGLPYFLPYLNVPEEPESDKNTVYQTLYQEYTSKELIYDSQTNYTAMNNTNMNITIKNGSRIAVVFNCPTILTIASTFHGGFVMFHVALVIEGVGNRTNFVGFSDFGPATGYMRQTTEDLYMNYMTDDLPSGTYNISVQWRSYIDVDGSNSLKVYSDHVNVSRSLMVQEIK